MADIMGNIITEPIEAPTIKHMKPEVCVLDQPNSGP